MSSSLKKNIEHLNVRVPKAEMETLRRYCLKNQRTQSDVIREFIRSLKIAKNDTDKE
jgi:hypothetical protein